MDKQLLADIVEKIKKSHAIAVFTGAGISVNAGIPDFRGKGGLYSFVQEKYSLPYPEAIFDIEYFPHNPAPFFDLSKELLGKNLSPTKAHQFLAYLEMKQKLEILVTQNIDLLHQKAGNKKILPCHGSYDEAHCFLCKKNYPYHEIEKELLSGEIPYCKECKTGIIKPDIVFFGEQLPAKFYSLLHALPNVDLLLVLGSSLTVQPASHFPLLLAQEVPSIMVNFTPTLYDSHFTHVIHDDLDQVSEKIWSLIEN